MSGRWSARPQSSLLQPQSWEEPFPYHPLVLQGEWGEGEAGN